MYLLHFFIYLFIYLFKFLFLNQFDFNFPVSQIMVMNTVQRKIKTKLTSLKI